MNKKVLYVISFLVVIICVLLFFVTRFYSSSLIAQDGYFVTGSQVDTVLMSESKSKKNSKIELVKMSSDDQVVSNLGKYYLSKEDKRTEINTDYPVFANNGLAIINYSTNNLLINRKFESSTTYENFTITDGKLYNYGDMSQADFEHYIFLQVNNGMLINLVPITFHMASKDIVIPINSIINFTDNSVKYYVYSKGGKLNLNQINGVALTDKLDVDDIKLTYNDLLIGLKKKAGESDAIKNIDEEYIIEVPEEVTPTPKEPKEIPFVQPKASVDPFTAKTYSATSNLHISDPSRAISGGINFTFSIGEKIFLRKTFVSSGKIQVNGLMPNTEYEVVGSFRYLNEEKKKIEAEFFRQKITTGDFGELDAIDLDFSNGDIYSNKIEIKNLRITSDLDSEVLVGLSKGYITINGNPYGVSSSIIQSMIQGYTTQYISPTSLQSNSSVDYYFTLYDGYGNELRVNHNSGHTRTSKEAPTSTFAVKANEVGNVEFSISLKNPNNVNIVGYRYIMYDSTNTIVRESDLDPSKSEQIFSDNNLDPNSLYTLRVIGSYDIEDGKGTVQDAVMGEGKFTTLPLASLGYVRVITKVSQLTEKSATLETNIDTSMVSSVLLSLLHSFEVEVTDSEGNIVYTRKYTGDEINDIAIGVPFESPINGLEAMHEYKIRYVAEVKQGRVAEKITVISEVKSFNTYKREAYVSIKDKFVNNNMIDFDVAIVDPDHAIESDRVVLEVRDKKGILFAVEDLEINGEYRELSYTKLDPQSDYSFKYYAEEYNIGYNNMTFENNYELLYEVINTEDGLSANIELVSMVRQITGSNLFDILDFERIRTEGNTRYKKYDLLNNAVMFGGKNGWVNFSYYVPEAQGKHITLSFYAKYDTSTVYRAPAYIYNTYNSSTSYLFTAEIPNISDQEYKFYTYEFTVNSPYIGFYLATPGSVNQRTNIWFKDISIVADSISEQAMSDVELSKYDVRHVFSNGVMKSGNDEIKSWQDGTTSIGNYGHGHARITNVTSGQVTDFSYTGRYQEYTVPEDGPYFVELWGAAGGDGSKFTNPNNLTISSHAGRGAYTSGTITLMKNEVLYFYVGGGGSYGKTSPASRYSGPVGGWNGGGDGGNSGSGSGGGATDVRLTLGNWDDETSLKSRIMVAAGGGGADDWNNGTFHGSNDGSGGAGGALSSEGAYINGVINARYKATQTQGYRFGVGQSVSTSTDTGGAGGGWYGGFVTNYGNGGGAGGSSYISGYLGCVSYKANAENGTTDVEYAEFEAEDTLLATFKINIVDLKEEIPGNDYYLRFFIDGKEIEGSPYRYDLTDHRAVDELRKFALTKNKNYTVILSVMIRDRFYDLDSYSFNTNFEIRSISTIQEFYDMFPNGRYVVVNDLDFTTGTTIENFYGQVDFQGHKISLYWGNRSYLFHYTRGGSVLKNVVLDVHLNNASAKAWYSPFVRYHYGTIDNVICNIVEATEVPNYADGMITYANYGAVKNFIIHNYVEPHATNRFGLVSYSNQGLVQNGIIYGEDINGNHETPDVTKDIGAIVAHATTNSRIENVFSLIGVKRQNIASEYAVGNLVGYAAYGQMSNCFSVEREDYLDGRTAQDPNFGRKNVMAAKNVYYFSKRNYSVTLSMKASFLALYDINFMNKTLNKENGFIVDEFVDKGYYPQLNLNECMPNQEWISLPSLTDADLIDVTSIEEESNEGDRAVVIMHLNNPSAEQITGVYIQSIQTARILSQENEDGKSTLRVELSNPMEYKSLYYLRVIESSLPVGYTYETRFGEKEKPIDITMYYLIHDLVDWRYMRSNPNDNYMLANDLDFAEARDADIIFNSSAAQRFKGVLNGNGHHLKNIHLTGSYNALIYAAYGPAVFKNLYIDNFSREYKSVGGGAFIYATAIENNNAVTFDNVHMNGVRIATTGGYVGGLVGDASGAVFLNSSVNDFALIGVYNNPTDIVVGGLVGRSRDNGYISNCYTQNIDIDVTDSFSTNGIGGIVGRIESGSIMNCYSTGKIESNSRYVGGIGGYTNAIIANVWSGVNVYGQHDYTGGIVGYRHHENMSNTLAVGNVYSTFSGNNVNRSSGNTLLIPQKNYYWSNQSYNGYIEGYATAEKPLTSEQLSIVDTYYDLLGFGKDWYYDDIGNGSIPKLRDTKGKLLPGQEDYIPVPELFDIVGAIEATYGSSANVGNIYFKLDNPDGLPVTGITFDYLTYKQSNFIQSYDQINKYTIVRITDADYTRAYDSYTLKAVSYKDKDGRSQTVPKHIKIDLQFFRDIGDYAAWATKVDPNTEENYRLTGDIDFSGRTFDINKNATSVSRLNGNGHKIKNITVNNISSTFAIIKKVNVAMYDLTFENISLTIKDTWKNGNYVNVIRFNYGDIERVNFDHVSIYAPLTNYVAPIGLNRGDTLRDIDSSYANIRGQTYVGGLVGWSEARDAVSVTGQHNTVYGTGEYIGGLVGGKDYINGCNWFYFSGHHMNVTGKNQTGGLFGRGGGNYMSISDSTVTGLTGGNYVGGLAGYIYDENTYYYSVDNLTIDTPNTTYVGGAFGFARHNYYTVVTDTTVTNRGTAETYTGGIVGNHDTYTHSYQGAINVTVTSSASSGGTGGLDGRLVGSGVTSYSYANNVVVNGINKVGGGIGYSGLSRFYYNTLNVKVNATGSYVGGVVGYMNNVDQESSSYSAVIHHNILENADVTGKDYVALFGGYAPDVLSDSFFYFNFIIGNVQVTQGNMYGPVLPENDGLGFTSNLPRFYIYDQNRYNGDLGSEIAFLKTTFLFSTSVNATELATKTYYTEHGITDYAASTSYYFYFKDQNGVPLVENRYYPQARILTPSDPYNMAYQKQEKISIPDGQVQFGRTSGATRRKIELPTLDVYSSGVDSINLEFSRDDPATLVTIYNDEEEVYSEYLMKRCYTFTYNYQSAIKVVLDDGTNRKIYTYEPEDVIQKVTAFSNSYAYIYDGALKGNVGSLDIHPIHLYGKYALTKSQDVYDLSTGKAVSLNNLYEMIPRDTISLFHFDLGASTIDTYYRYSVIHKTDSEVIYDGQIFYQNGAVEVVDPFLENDKTSIIVDSSGGKNYVTVLGNDGIIYNLKSEIEFPSGFTNSGIDQMTHNVNNKSNMVVVMYKTGRVVVFDYRTGTQKVAEKATEKISIVEYIKENVNLRKMVGSSKRGYNESLELAKTLEEKPIIQDSNGDYVFGDKGSKKASKYKFASNYVTYYNSVRQDYEVIDLSEVVLGDQKEVVSENNKIYTSDDLVGFYMKESVVEKASSNISIVVLLGIVLFSVLVALGFVFKNAKDVKVEEK